MSASSLAKEKEHLIQRLKASGYLRSEDVERDMRRVPREEFVLPEMRDEAYRDTPLPLFHGQTISAPHMCAIMCEGLGLKVGLTVLEVGTGSGYHAALCAEIVSPEGASKPGHVYTVEIVKPLVDFATANLSRCGYKERVTVIHGDGGKGLEEKAPFDRILVAAAAPDIPRPLIQQLRPGGILLIPVGPRGFYQELLFVEKDLDSRVTRKNWGGVAFVPLTGEYG
ncbi:MAG: protein-L-isoaspartate(D-aspartate) O-methyltransferase [Candidatus Thorarchaeota archaeon]|nr:protein-L-isoaspartate(D-aspartate) O-methyltransferase [Candidatus Thorarchaeota archaeon]